jgi:hypothetical protein
LVVRRVAEPEREHGPDEAGGPAAYLHQLLLAQLDHDAHQLRRLHGEELGEHWRHESASDAR